MQSEPYARDIATSQRIGWRETSRETSFLWLLVCFLLSFFSISSFSRSISEIFLGQSPYVFSKRSYALGNRMPRQWHAYLARSFQQTPTSHYNVGQTPRALWSRTRDRSPLCLRQVRVNRGFQSMKNLDPNFRYCGHVRFLRVFIHTAKISEEYLKNV